MQPHELSWFKILSFFGAGISLFFAFVNGGGAGVLISKGYGFNGVSTILSAIGWLVVAILIYKNYTKKSDAGLPGVKIENLKK